MATNESVTTSQSDPRPLMVDADTDLLARLPGTGLINLPPGTALTEDQAQQLAGDRPQRLIAMAGAVDCGKTTLLTSVYELFQEGPITSFHFAGCDTLPAFEKRCHLSRTDSDKNEPDTGRTPYDGPHPEYLHLRIHNETSLEDPLDFLFTDISGEMFEHARNSIEECKKLTFLLRASHLLLFLDCQKALQHDKRWGMVQDAKSLLQSFLDSKMLPSECFVTIVWAKCDHFAASSNKQSLTEFVTYVESDFFSSFGTRITRLKFHRAAARPTRFPDLKMGFGVRELLSDWVVHCPHQRHLQLEPPNDNGGQRESELFAKRHFAQQALG